MMTKFLLSAGRNASIFKVIPSEACIMGTSAGLDKTINEDRLGCITQDGITRFCIADGHWGDAAAQLAVDFWLNEENQFPKSRDEAVMAVGELESRIAKTFGQPHMDPERDFTPETSLTVAEVADGKLRAIGYGDCRLLVVRRGDVAFTLPTHGTWLGAFSKHSLRGRQPIANALVFETFVLQSGDCVFLFSDGIDQCVYEKQTIEPQAIASSTSLFAPEAMLDSLFAEVFRHGAQDNASLAIIRV